MTKSYTYLGHIITDNLCDEADIKAKVGCLYGRSNILLTKFYFCFERVKNRLFSDIVVTCISVLCVVHLAFHCFIQ